MLNDDAHTASKGATPGASVPQSCFQLTFIEDMPGATFSVIAATNVSLSFNQWTLLGQPVRIRPGLFQFTDLDACNNPHRFYQVISQMSAYAWQRC